jgi:hypothetical protein
MVTSRSLPYRSRFGSLRCGANGSYDLPGVFVNQWWWYSTDWLHSTNPRWM